ncbi:MAG: polyphenol oxidase family protein [Euzebya sp.]
MTTTPRSGGVTSASPVTGVQMLPEVPLQGRLAASVGYAFSDRQLGTMSQSVGEGDHRRARTALAAACGLESSRVAWMHQVHGSDVVEVATATSTPSCDGICTTTPGLGLAVLAADCVPVLMASPAGVAAAHSGRPGLVAGVATATAARLCQISGCEPSDLEVVIGPAIGPCCYEVPEAMAQAVESVVSGTSGRTTWGTPSVDLIGGVTKQLGRLGIGRLSRAGGCTRCEGQGRWFSHRASGGLEKRTEGRQAGIVVWQEGAES